MLQLEGGLSDLPVVFYRMKIGPFLAELWPKTSRKASDAWGQKGGGALNGEFTVFRYAFLLHVRLFYLLPVILFVAGYHGQKPQACVHCIKNPRVNKVHLTLSVLCARSCLRAVRRGRSPEYATF